MVACVPWKSGTILAEKRCGATVADLHNYPEPHANLAGDAFLPDPPANRPRPNFGPVPVHSTVPDVQLPSGPHGEKYESGDPESPPEKMSIPLQIALFVILFAIVIIFVALFD